MAYLVENESPESSLASRESLEASLAVDPHSAEAWSQLALVLARDVLNNWNHATREDLADAEEALQKAFAIDPSIDIAHLAYGYIHRLKGDQQGALVAFDRALELNPNSGLAYAEKANQLVILGRPKEGPPLVLKAIALSPRDPYIGTFYWIIGRAYFVMEDCNDAIAWLQRSVEVGPDLWFNRAYLLSAYALIGNAAMARTILADFGRLFRTSKSTLANMLSYEANGLCTSVRST
jgi:adenylate cyclase